METTWKAVVWRQLEAAIDTLENAIAACPEDLWQAHLWTERELEPDAAAFWYVAYHCLFFLDFDSSETAEGFSPPAPFTLSEMDPSGRLPERVYTKEELQRYLAHGRSKSRARIESVPDLLAPQRLRSNKPWMSVGELLIYTTRHVQEHAAQLNLYLGQQVGSAPGWVSKGSSELKEA